MAITQALCTSFKAELLLARHNFGITEVRASTSADVFKCALYLSSATLDAATSAYSATDEVANGNGYTTGGATITISQVPTTTGTTAWLDFADLAWTSSTFVAGGAVVYNSTQGNKSVGVLSFGADKTVTNGTFTLQWPVADSSNAIIRIA